MLIRPLSGLSLTTWGDVDATPPRVNPRNGVLQRRWRCTLGATVELEASVPGDPPIVTGIPDIGAALQHWWTAEVADIALDGSADLPDQVGSTPLENTGSSLWVPDGFRGLPAMRVDLRAFAASAIGNGDAPFAFGISYEVDGGNGRVGLFESETQRMGISLPSGVNASLFLGSDFTVVPNAALRHVVVSRSDTNGVVAIINGAEYSFATAASITVDQFGVSASSPMYIREAFLCNDTIGLDAADLGPVYDALVARSSRPNVQWWSIESPSGAPGIDRLVPYESRRVEITPPVPGHYCIGARRPGAGACLFHFDVEAP
jgi:hypothetical protein